MSALSLGGVELPHADITGVVAILQARGQHWLLILQHYPWTTVTVQRLLNEEVWLLLPIFYWYHLE